MTNESTNRIIDKQFEDEVKKDFLDYAMSVITSRALPDVRDGLKPVQRRILFSMFEQNMLAKGGHYKSARIVGDVIGKYHPHGDSAVYGALVRLAQPFSLIANLIEGHGNFGSIDGSPPAAMRYTEAKLTKISEELLKGINKNTVEFVDNYDGRNREPKILPARFPNILVNGVSGIAVSMATEIPTHNLKEVIETTIEYIKNENITEEEIMEIMPGPDFPTGGKIYGKDGILQAYKTGKGSFTIRGNVHLEEIDGRQVIVITQIPYGVQKQFLIDKIKEIQKEYDVYKQEAAKLARSNSKVRTVLDKPAKAYNFAITDGVEDRTDVHSTDDNLRIEIHLIDGVDPNVVINHLYKYTPLQTNFSYNNTVLVPYGEQSRPKVLGVKGILSEYLKHQIIVYRNELNFELEKHQKELHYTEALIKALDQLDETLKIIRESKTTEESITSLMNFLSIDEEQAKYILDKRIRTLTGYQQEETKERYEFLLTEIKRIQNILNDDDQIKELIVNELERIKDEYGMERRSQIFDSIKNISTTQLIQNDKIVVMLTNNGYLKSVKESKFKNQRRNGRGVNSMKLDSDDFIAHLEVMYKHDSLLFFTNKGKVFVIKGYDIPEMLSTSKGVHIFNLLPGLEDDERVQSVVSVKVFADDQYLFFSTAKGTVKRTALSQYEHIRKTGIIAIDLESDDRLVNVSLTDGTMNIILVTNEGKSISFKETDVRATNRNTRGSRGIRLAKNDFVVTSDIHERFGDIFIITENGFGKRTTLELFKIQKRGGSGMIAQKVTEKTGKVVSTVVVSEEDSVIILSKKGSLIKMSAKQISKFNRMAQGTKLINLRSDDEVKTASRTSIKEENLEDNNEETEEI